MIRKKRIISLAIVFVMCLGIGIQADASELNETREKASQLQDQKKAAESEKASGKDRKERRRTFRKGRRIVSGKGRRK